MHRYACHLLAAALCIALPAVPAARGAGAAAEAADGTGRIELLGTNTVDFGKYPASEERTAQYAIRNHGDGLLRITRVRKTCGCSRAESDRTELQPGETGTVTVVINAHSITGPYTRKTYVESTDPDRPSLCLQVKGHQVPLFSIAPRHRLYCGRLPLGAGWTTNFTLRADSTEPRLGEPRADSNYEVALALTREQNTNVTYDLAVRLLPTAQPGKWECTVRVPVLAPPDRKPEEIKVEATLGGSLYALPSYVRLPLEQEAPTRHRFRLRLKPVDRGTVLDPDRLVLPDLQDVTFAVEKSEYKTVVWIVAEFAPAFTHRLAEQREIVLPITYPGAAPARLVCQSAQR